MSRHVQIVGLTVMLALSASAEAMSWQLKAVEAGRGPTLTYAADQAVSYRFECVANDVVITETGVTKLMDLNTGKPIGDDSGAVMPAGAAMMALFGGKGDPKFMPAEAVKNPVRGWDLTIRLPKNDKQLKAIGKSEMMSLFTTGYTMAVAMDSSARAQWNEFLKACSSK